jgi:hypothetical protein
MGQSRRFDGEPLTSGLPQLRTFSAPIGMSRTCQGRKLNNLFDDLVRASEQSWWCVDVECLGSFKISD